MAEPSPLPATGGLDTLLDVLAGWYEAGAASQARRLQVVKRLTGLGDAVDHQTPFLTTVRVLEPVGEAYRLTDTGAELAEALMGGDVGRAMEAGRALVEDLPISLDIEGAINETPLLGENRQPPTSASVMGDASREAADASMVLDLLEQIGLPVRDAMNHAKPAGGAIRLSDGSGPPGRLPVGQQLPPTNYHHQSPPHSYQQQSIRFQPLTGQRSAPTESELSPPTRDTGEERYRAHDHALSLRLNADNVTLDIDGEGDNLEEIVRAVRRGLLPDEESES